MAIKIKGKEYDEKKLTDQAKAWLAIMRDLQTNKVRLAIDLNNCEILINHHGKLVDEELAKIKSID